MARSARSSSSSEALRALRPADAALVAAGVSAGLRTYRDWAPAGWAPPRIEPASLGIHLHRAFGFVAPAGHVAVLPESVGATPVTGTAHLWQLVVARERWGTGLAHDLLHAAVSDARVRGYEHVVLWTPRDHGRARRFYEREGFTPTGVARFDDELGLGLLRLELSPRCASGSR